MRTREHCISVGYRTDSVEGEKSIVRIIICQTVRCLFSSQAASSLQSLINPHLFPLCCYLTSVPLLLSGYQNVSFPGRRHWDNMEAQVLLIVLLFESRLLLWLWALRRWGRGVQLTQLELYVIHHVALVRVTQHSLYLRLGHHPALSCVALLHCVFQRFILQGNWHVLGATPQDPPGWNGLFVSAPIRVSLQGSHTHVSVLELAWRQIRNSSGDNWAQS